MIHEGERTQESKIKEIYKFNESQKKFKKELSKRFHILFVCSECGLQILYQPITEHNKYERLDYDYDDYKECFKNDPDFKPFEKKYKNLNIRSWGGAEKICMDCGKGLFADENTDNTCLNCKGKNIITGNEINGKPCPICGTEFYEGIKLQGYDAYETKIDELRDFWWNKYRKKYNVKKLLPKIITEEEIKEKERIKSLTKCYQENDFYVIGNKNNVIRFEFRDAWLKGFNIILEWFSNENGKLTVFERHSMELTEIIIEYEKIEKIIQIINEHNYFEKRFYKKTFGLDGYTFGVEIKIEDKYKELAMWGIRSGILYDVGMLLLEFAGKTFKDYYKYAW